MRPKLLKSRVCPDYNQGTGIERFCSKSNRNACKRWQYAFVTIRTFDRYMKRSSEVGL